jgi:hypothetical protein
MAMSKLKDQIDKWLDHNFDPIPAVLPAKQLRENTIETLDLSNKGLGIDGGLMLAALMAGNHSTHCLHVFSNEIPEDTLRAIMNSNGSIRTFGGAAKLDFSGKGLDSADVKVLAELLKDNKTATCLNVMGNKIGPEGAKSVGELLKINNTLTQLVMCDNEMKAEGATALADGLKSNSDLLCLHVFGCSLGQAGGKAVGEALKTNETLDEVLVGSLMVGCTVRLKSSGEEKVVTRYDSSDGILYEGKTNSWTKYSEFDTILAVLPAKQLRENTIETLDLSNMGLGIDGGLMLAALMAGNGSLRCLDASKNWAPPAPRPSETCFW